VFGAILVQICIGAIYSWSLFNQPLMVQYGWTESQVVLTFSIAVFVFALTTMFSGRLQDIVGPRVVATIGGVLYGGGLILSSFSSSLLTLYLSYGLVAGIGVGFAYVCPIVTCVKWFPNNKGIITGVSVGAFGLGSFIFKFIIQESLMTQGIQNTFLLIGIIYLTLILIGAQFLVVPDKKEETNTNNVESQKCFNVKEMTKTKSFYYIFMIFLLGCISGLLVIGLAKDIGVDIVKLDPLIAANAVAIIALFNASGRITWGYLTDKINVFKVILSMFFITTICMAILSFFPLNFYLYFITLSGIAFCFGGFLTIFPIITDRFYGHKNHGANYGVVYQAYGISALLGPIIHEAAGSLTSTFMIATILSSLGILLTISFKRFTKIDIMHAD